jgi:beta-galactosidase/beta-glucuronidase
MFRHATLSSTAPVHARSHGFRSPHFVEGPMPNSPGNPAAGLTAESVTLTPSLEIDNDLSSNVNATVLFQLIAADGETVVASTQTTLVVPPSASGPNATDSPAPATATISPFVLTGSAVQLWSVARPYLYTLVATVSVPGGATPDVYSTAVGLRSIQWDSETGVYLSGQAVKLRGFCNHESFAGVGAAIADRIDL